MWCRICGYSVEIENFNAQHTEQLSQLQKATPSEYDSGYDLYIVCGYVGVWLFDAVKIPKSAAVCLYSFSVCVVLQQLELAAACHQEALLASKPETVI